MNVLSLFDGMSCGQIALERAGIEVENYFASEIDENAIKVSAHNYPDIKRLGDITKWESWDIDYSKIDLVLGGFPCQAWSIAGKQLGDKDERGKLFWVMLDIMKKVLKSNPNAKYLMENVKMKKEFDDYITYHTSQTLGIVYKYHINSRNISAQNRPRIFWTNINGIQEPNDREIFLKDILEINVDSKYNLSQKAIDYMSRFRNDKPRWEYHKNLLNGKASCLTANMYKGVPYGVIKELLRRLTPLECERLQTVPDNYTNCVKDTHRYKMLGNGWTIDVISHIFSYLK